jgi:hypothetical protein
MIMPRVSQTVAYDGFPYNVLGYPVIENHPHIELSQCPGTLDDPNAGWHETWKPFDSIFILTDDFTRRTLRGVSVN